MNCFFSYLACKSLQIHLKNKQWYLEKKQSKSYLSIIMTNAEIDKAVGVQIRQVNRLMAKLEECGDVGEEDARKVWSQELVQKLQELIDQDPTR